MGNTQTNEIFQQTMFDYWKVSNLVTPGSEMLTHTHTSIFCNPGKLKYLKLMDKIFIGPLNEKPLQYHLLSLGNQVHCCCISKIEEDFAQPGCVLGICKTYRNTMTQENIHPSSGELCTHMGIPGFLPARKLAAPKIALASRVAETSQECLTG